MKEGFTLIETLIVLAITAILSTIFLAYNSSSNGQVALYTERAQVVGALQRAKTLALDKYMVSPGSTSSCAFGVHFQTSTGVYSIYGKYPPPGSTDCTAGYGFMGNSSDTVVQSLQLQGKVGFVDPTPSDIYFVPPYFIANATGTITLKSNDSGATASIEVTQGGSISSL